VEDHEDPSSSPLLTLAHGRSIGLHLYLGDQVNAEHDSSSGIARAIEWALNLDAQYRELISAGHRPRVDIPSAGPSVAGQVSNESLSD